MVGLLVAKETPPKATSIHPQVHIAPFSILVKNLQNALLDITTKDITRERSLPVAFIAWCDLYKPYKIRECSLPTAYIDVTSSEKTTKCILLEIANQHSATCRQPRYYFFGRLLHCLSTSNGLPAIFYPLGNKVGRIAHFAKYFSEI